ncbi:MAG: Na(+)-translocating NADH-quinone reductase subunit A [Pseudomonadales bacterium]|nr:Na(+)-translocating NADH-quinone reductase subunit A [Pseudomonadales bacterium]
MIKIKRGLDVPIDGAPEACIYDATPARSVAIVGFDYVGLKPTMSVAVGDKVAKGQLLFEDKKTAGVKFTAPAAGTVTAINRGAKRVFESIVIDVNGDADANEITFEKYDADKLASLERQHVVDNLVNSGLWTTLRTRPFSKTPEIDATPTALFINCMDTNPLALDPMLVINEDNDSREKFLNGVTALSHLSDRVFVCQGHAHNFPKIDVKNVKIEIFEGKHPAGNSGTHNHFLAPASESRHVWNIAYQDVMAVGELFTTGKLNMTRVVALAGPAVEKPRLLRTRVGADLTALTAGELISGENRVISGSVLSGRTAEAATAYLGRFATQVSCLAEGRDREFMGWLSPGANRHSKLNIYISAFMGGKKFKFNTNTNGSPRAMVPLGTFEDVMPLDILPTQLLRAIVVGDEDTAIKLGVLELDEEDLALCTYVCSGKYEYGPILRANLTKIEKEG